MSINDATRGPGRAGEATLAGVDVRARRRSPEPPIVVPEPTPQVSVPPESLGVPEEWRDSHLRALAERCLPSV
jgi:hypothetical protein